MKYFDDIMIGERHTFGCYTFTAEAIKDFAGRFDPQLFHLDEATAEQSHFGALCASGWHTAVMWMRLQVDYRCREADARRARGEPVAKIGPSPGFRELKWLTPVYAGDTITYATEVTATRPSATRPQWGLMTTFNTGINQNGVRVLSFASTAFIERRPQ